MPAPAVYIVGAVGVVAAVVAFKQFIYEPHIAPQIEAWAESFIEHRRRQRHRHAPVLAQPYPLYEHNDENQARRIRNDPRDNNAMGNEGGTSVELEQLAAQETRGWAVDGRQTGLRYRRTAGVMDESNAFIPYSPISPTHVIFDSSVPSSPTSPSEGCSRIGSPAPAADVPAFNGSLARSPSISGRQNIPNIPQIKSPIMSPRLPTPVSISSVSSRVVSPDSADAVRSPFSYPSSRVSTPDAPAMYNTALMGPVNDLPSQEEGATLFVPYSRAQSPFSDVYSEDMRSPTLSMRSSAASPLAHFSSSESDFDLHTDDEDEVLSLRSGMFSPSSEGVRVESTFDVQSQHGSDVSSWASVGRNTPDI